MLSLFFQRTRSFSTKLIHDYVKNGNTKTARLLWKSIGSKTNNGRDIKIYGLMMGECLKNKEFDECLHLFWELHQREIPINDAIYLIMLKACFHANNYEIAKFIHSDIINNKAIHKQIKIQNALIGLYTKFDRNVAFEIFHNLKNIDLEPNEVTFLHMLKLIGITKNAQCGIKMHETIKSNRACYQEIKIQNALISMYAQCNDFESALSVFHDVKNGIIGECKADDITYLNMIKCCSMHKRLEEGMLIHKDIENLITSIKLQNALIHFYGHCNEYEQAETVFHKMRRRDILTYCAILNVCQKCGKPKESEIFLKILQSDSSCSKYHRRAAELYRKKNLLALNDFGIN